MDTLTPEQRSAQMALVKGRDTRPELAVREALRSLGFRPAHQPKGIPGHPDYVLRRVMLAIFVHGCFWHRHKACARTRMPKSRVEFWSRKFEDNVRRDRAARRALRELGWKVVVIWECQTENADRLRARLSKHLEAR